MRKTAGLLGVILAASSVLLILSPNPRRERATGLRVTIALAAPCGSVQTQGEQVRMLGPGRVRLKTDEVDLEELSGRLQQAFREETRRVVFISGGAGLVFHEAAEVIATAARQADYVALVTPAVERAVEARSGRCLDANIRFPRIVM